MTVPDLLVAGAGGGLVGALRAQQLGADVAVVEASPAFRRGNNTSMSTAMIPGAGSRMQRSLGIVDSPDAFVADLLRKTHGDVDEVVARALAEVSAPLVEWLADAVGMPVELVVDFQYPGHSVHRCHTVPGRSGASLLAGLVAAVERAGIHVLTGARLTALRPLDGGYAATVTYPDGSSEQIQTRCVLLATNGFGAASDLVARHIPEIAAATYHGSDQSRGDALRIGRELGAATAYLDAYQGHGALVIGTATLAGWATIMHGGLIVNKDGRRFADETQGYSEFAGLELQQPDHWAAIVIDQRIHDECMRFADFRQTVQMGALRTAEGPRSLAVLLGIPPDPFVATLADVSAFARCERSDPLGRSNWSAELRGPLSAIRVEPALFHTQGGLRVNGHAQVLDRAASPLGSVYASGGAAAGISGHGAAGYLAGNGLLCALGLSFLAAEHVVSSARP